MDPRRDPRKQDPRDNYRQSSDSFQKKRSISREDIVRDNGDFRKKPRDHSAHSRRSREESSRSRSRPPQRRFSSYHPWGGVHSADTGTVSNGPFSYSAESDKMTERMLQQEIKKRLEYAKGASLGLWVAPKDVQAHRYRNFLVPALPRSRSV